MNDSAYTLYVEPQIKKTKDGLKREVHLGTKGFLGTNKDGLMKDVKRWLQTFGKTKQKTNMKT